MPKAAAGNTGRKAKPKSVKKEFDAATFSEERARDLARCRWLNVSELECILDSNNPLFDITPHPPKSPPVSGSIFLYDRSATRNYKDDGHVWIKKRNSPKVREDHVKLRIGGRYRVAGCYVHSADVSTMHRRAYHLLDPNAASSSPNYVNEEQKTNISSGNAMKPVFAGASKAISTLVLVHYLDTDIAGKIMNGEVAMEVGKINSSGSSSNSRTMGNISNHSPTYPGSITTPFHSAHQKYPNPAAEINQHLLKVNKGLHVNHLNDYNNVDEGNPMDCGEESGENIRDVFMSSMGSMGDSLYNLFDESENNMNVHDGNEEPSQVRNKTPGQMIFASAPRHNSQLSESSFYEFVSSSFEPSNGSWSELPNSPRESSTSSLTLKLDDENIYSAKPSYLNETMTDASPEVYDYVWQQKQLHRAQSHDLTNLDSIPETLSATAGSMRQPLNNNDYMSPKHWNSDAGNETQAQSMTLPQVIDVTPDHVTYRPNSNKQSKIVISFSNPVAKGGQNLHFFIAFVDTQKENLSGDNLNISPAFEVNPFTYRCVCPRLPSDCNRAVFLFGSPPDYSSGYSDLQLLSDNLQKQWKEVVARMPTNKAQLLPTFFAWRKVVNVCFLSQISDDVIEFTGFQAIFQPLSISTSNDSFPSTMNTKSDSSQANDVELPAPPAAMASIAVALSDFPDVSLNENMELKHTADLSENSYVAQSKKRTALTIDIPDDTQSMIYNLASNSVGAEVDRHCKIRFVEKLTTVIAGAEEGESNVTDNTWTIPSVEQSGLSDPNSSSNSLVQNVEAFLDDGQLEDIDDDQLDSLLDSLLIRIVEMLVEMSSSDIELQEELNAPDKSGFTLIHYASLYNLQSLLPVLLSRGANSDALSVRGKLTPLHLACGAGHFAVVELLTRNGCAIEVKDSSLLTPADHAIRNGFPDIAKWLAEKSGKDLLLSNNVNQQRAPDLERKVLLQSAFSNLSLKDKLAFNLMVKKGNLAQNSNQKRKGKNVGTKTSVQKLSIPEGEGDELSVDDECVNGSHSPENIELNGRDRTISVEAMLSNINKEHNVNVQDDDDDHSLVSSCISESDRESLDVAMSLMNEEELDEIDQSSNAMRGDVRKWMLRHNYKSLKEATLYLQSSLKKKSTESTVQSKSASAPLERTADSKNKRNEQTSQSTVPIKKNANIEAKRSIKNFKNQTLATLVIRKNILGGRQAVSTQTNNTSPPVKD